MGNTNPNCKWPQCDCKTEKNEPCKFENPDFYIKRKVSAINVEPKWIALVPLMVSAIENGTPKGRAIAIEELQRMAEAADNWNAHTLSRKGRIDRCP